MFLSIQEKQYKFLWAGKKPDTRKDPKMRCLRGFLSRKREK